MRCVPNRILTALGALAFLFLLNPASFLQASSHSAYSGPVPVSVSPSPNLPAKGTIVFTAEQNGHWDLYAAANGRQPARITRDVNPVRQVAVSREGMLAFSSKRDGNWEIYSSALDGSGLKRLTNLAAYDGNPAWSPDGKKIAFESFRADDLDIWTMDSDGTNPTNLTAANPTYDFDPAWSPDGKWIAYTSVQNSYKQIMLISGVGGKPVNLSNSKVDDEQPTWSPDGKQLAFVSTRDGQRAIYFATIDPGAGKMSNVRRMTFFGWDFAPTFSPDGQSLAFISIRPTRQTIYVMSLAGGTSIPYALDDQARWVSSLAWTDRSLPSLKSLPDEPPLVVEQPVRAASDAGHPYEVRGITEIYLAPSYGNMSSRISTSLLALRDRVKSESGQDFIGQMSDMMRQLVYPCSSSCDILSWHKTGRAFDTLWEFGLASQGLLAIVPEPQNGELYWRIYLRAAKQDGTMGEPIKVYPWDLSDKARATGKGGTERPIPNGYYIDFTELAREYGWTRIPSADDPDFDWHDNFLALEYWHYEKRDGLDWYHAMLEMFSPADISANFDWANLVATRREDGRYLYVKSVPPPPGAWKWFAVLPPGN